MEKVLSETEWPKLPKQGVDLVSMSCKCSDIKGILFFPKI
jgi:hypothetical protein